MHKTTNRFRRLLEDLPHSVQENAEESFENLKRDPSYPSLHFKKVGKFWSARAGAGYRALALEDGSDFIWVWIGAHDEYERIIKHTR